MFCYQDIPQVSDLPVQIQMDYLLKGIIPLFGVISLVHRAVRWEGGGGAYRRLYLEWLRCYWVQLTGQTAGREGNRTRAIKTRTHSHTAWPETSIVKTASGACSLISKWVLIWSYFPSYLSLRTLRGPLCYFRISLADRHVFYLSSKEIVTLPLLGSG